MSTPNCIATIEGGYTVSAFFISDTRGLSDGGGARVWAAQTREILMSSVLSQIQFKLIFLLFGCSDKMFPALGFGAKLPDGTVSHEFFMVSYQTYLLS